MCLKMAFVARPARGWRRPGNWKGIALLAILYASCSRPVSSPPVAEDIREPFTIAVLPDTQHYSRKYPDRFYAQTAWIHEHARTENIVFATQLGDIVNDGAKDMKQWQVAANAMSLLDGVVPWGVAIGNHDFDKPSDRSDGASTFIKHFGPDRFKNAPWYVGAAPSQLSSCQLFSGAGRSFIFLHLQLDAPKKDLAWAEEMLRRYPDRPAIVSTHSYLKGRDGIARNPEPVLKHGNSGEDLWNKLIRKNPQIFMVLCGHQGRTVHYRQISTNDAGKPVLELLADYQRQPLGGDATLRLLRFEPTRQRIHVRTYSPFRNAYDPDDDSDFTLPWSPPAPR